ncbi:hypothetical protein [Undibacterium pigrum]|uniref:Uncharacterized protein n=1 Tax=Undibacterium pigrum TaxID=401470 RepID=A0A318JK86_9BURK|nr:hypothetical protein [Undibacterium pigrum]PXX47542.1 hypothetical protein DFR42_1011125 [Undibacterium pigrum]
MNSGSRAGPESNQDINFSKRDHLVSVSGISHVTEAAIYGILSEEKYSDNSDQEDELLLRWRASISAGVPFTAAFNMICQ